MGLLNNFIKILKQGELEQAKIQKNKLPQDDVTIGTSGITFKATDDKSIEALNQALKEEGYKGPGLNLSRIGEVLSEKMGQGMKTLDMEELLLAIQKDNEQLFNFLKRDTQNLEKVVATAKGMGLQKIADTLLRRNPGEVLSVEHLVGGVIAIGSLSRKLDTMATSIKSMPQGEAKRIEYKKFLVNLQVLNNLTAQVSGVTSESARTLSMVSAIKKLTDVDLEQVYLQGNKIGDAIDDNMIDAQLNYYATLPKPNKLEFAKRGFFAKTYDVLMEIYINSLLASPVTHMVNIAGNAIYNIQRTAETGLAGFVGETRQMMGLVKKEGDRVFLGEASAEMHGTKMAMLDAVKTFGLTLSIEGAESVGSKIDLKNLVAIGDSDNIRHIMEQARNGDYLGMGVNAIGVMTRMPGRFLASEDAFFKTISERKVLYREAFRESKIKYMTLIKGGVSKDVAKKQAEDLYVNIIDNPPEDIKKIMFQEAKISTFQETPEGIWGALVSASNIPGGKVIVPFSKTPTNIVKAVFDRTLNWSPVFRAIKKGETGIEFDQAISKLAIGNTIFASMVYLASGEYGDNIIINGSGPSDPKARKYMTASNIPPYSIGLKQENGEYKFITFSRFDPLSGVLAMASDYAYYANNSNDSDMISLESLFVNGALAVAEYAMNMPFLQGVSELHGASFNPQGTTQKLAERLSQYLGQKVGNVRTSTGDFINQFLPGQPIIGASSFTATLERVGNPDASNTMLNEEQLLKVENSGMPNFMRGFYLAMNQAKARNPLFSSELPPRLNYWGEVVQQSSGSPLEYFSPIKVTTGGYDDVNGELLRLAENGSGVFQGHKKRQQGIYLTAEQYNDYIGYFNNINVVNNNRGLYLDKADPGWSPANTVLEKIKRKINDPSSGYNQLRDDEKFDELNQIRSEHSSGALDKLIEKYPDLGILLKQPNQLEMGISQ